MSADQPLPHAVRAEILNVVWSAFYYRDDFKSLMLGAGVPAAIYNRYDDPDKAKVKIARAVLDELQDLRAPGWRIQRKIATELCAMRRPANGVTDVKAGLAAIDQLRRAAEAANVIVDTEQAAINERKARAARQQKQIDDRRELISDLSNRFAALAIEKPRTPGSVDYEVRIGIERNGPERMIMQTRDNMGGTYTAGFVPMLRYLPVEATVETGADDDRYMHQVRTIIQDCVNQGGVSNLRLTAQCPCEECRRRG